MNWQQVLFRSVSLFFFFLSAAIYCPHSVFPQSDGNGKISGFIYNSSQQPLSGVEVRAVATSGTYFYRMTYSDQNGNYALDDLPVGQYYVRVQNKLGYLNTYYNNVLDKSEAKLIKLNSDQHVRNINFYLSRGGFIAGKIFDDKGTKITTSSSVGFLDANSFNSLGFINSNSDGSYISPALPQGPHIVKASSIPGGYVMTYFNNVSTQDRAQPVVVTVGDTVKNIDFYLQKGGAISGQVYADDLDQTPIADAWVVVSDWNTGEWSSEYHSDPNGEYCAAGLRPGEYRVFIFSVDPLKYHTQFYKNAAQYENAAKVYITNKDTVRNIDFKLNTVKQLTLPNDFIEIAVSDRYPGTNLTMNITGGLPETISDNGKPILFGHPHPYTSFTTLWIDGKETNFGSNEGTLLIDPYITHDQKGISRTWRIGNLEVEQKISFVVSEWSETKYEDTAQLQYIIKNTDEKSHKVGLRMLLDTMLGRDDAAPIRTSTATYSEYERDFFAPNIPKWWAAIEGYNNITMFSVQGTLSGYGAKTPDQFSIVNWSNIFKTKWEYKTSGDVRIINDSGVALWWYPADIGPGKVAIYCTFLGLGAMYPDKVPPYTQNHIPARGDSKVSPATSIQLDVLDDYMGVDKSTIAMWVNNVRVTPAISGDLNKYSVTYNPPEAFRFNDTVNVVVAASDLAIQPNVMVPDSYNFYIEKDSLPPYIDNLYPKPFSENIAPDTCLSFSLFDDHSGIDTNSIRITLNDNPIPYLMEGDQHHLKIYYRFDPPYGERDSVSVKIFANDLVFPPNPLDSIFYFHITRDSIAPRIEFHYPADQATEVPLDTNVIIDIVDDLSGIDRNSIMLLKNNQPVVPKITGDLYRLRLIYQPESGFLYNDQIKMNLTVSDLAKQTNTLADSQFTFYSVTDKLPPKIVRLNPAPGDTSVNPSPMIKIEIADDKSGVDSTSISITINGKSVKFKIEGDDRHYYLSHQWDGEFDYLEWVKVEISAQDKSNPTNPMDLYAYSFRIIREKDVTPPYTRLHIPENGERDVLPDSAISFHILDDRSGVDSSTIRLKVNDELVQPIITGHRHDYAVYYKPIEPFWYGDSVNIKINASDLAVDSVNVMETVEYSFHILNDTEPPEIVWKSPGLPGSHIPLDAEFIIDLIDALAGVNIESFVFKFQGEVKHPVISGNRRTYTAFFKPEQLLEYNDTIKIQISVSDLATESNWIREREFVFYSTEDHSPPYISSRHPEKNETGAPFEAPIIIQVNDDIAGVDIASIKLAVEGNTVVPEISGTPSSYSISYKNPKEYEAGQLVDVMISCSDLSNPPLSMSESYSFKIEEIYPDLYVESFAADQSKLMVNTTLTVKAIIGVATVSVKREFDIRLLDGNKVLMDSTIDSIEVGEKIEVTRTIAFVAKGTHPLTFVIDPGFKIKESDEENNKALLNIEVNEGELTVRSNPFTPNGDGINDIVIFNFEQLSVTDPQLKLYDVSGRMIATFEERIGFTFVWNGSDRFGNQAQPGVYLYLLQDQNQVIANGYVVLAR
ncbi:MAG: carboxypeptidase regulatory-like domain-containing protein [bacterium]|nr:carboxypeptidase regulatory-like domain-containing protein [bacterium]